MTPFDDFHRAQERINQFFWSSELSYEIVRQLVLERLSKEERRQRVYKLFHNRVKARVFFKTTRQKRQASSGRPPGRVGHYHASANDFEDDLKRNIEHASLYVLIHIQTMLETFLKKRLGGLGFPANRLTELWRTYPGLPRAIESRGVQLLQPIDLEVLWRAEIYRSLRNIVTHEQIDLAGKPWTDTSLRTKLQNKNCPAPAVQAVCDKARTSTDRAKDLPLLFFYALYGLTDYRKMAEQVDEALPRKAVAVTVAGPVDAFSQWYDGRTAKFRKGLSRESAEKAWNGAVNAIVIALESGATDPAEADLARSFLS